MLVRKLYQIEMLLVLALLMVTASNVFAQNSTGYGVSSRQANYRPPPIAAVTSYTKINNVIIVPPSQPNSAALGYKIGQTPPPMNICGPGYTMYLRSIATICRAPGKQTYGWKAGQPPRCPPGYDAIGGGCSTPSGNSQFAGTVSYVNTDGSPAQKVNDKNLNRVEVSPVAEYDPVRALEVSLQSNPNPVNPTEYSIQKPVTSRTVERRPIDREPGSLAK